VLQLSCARVCPHQLVGLCMERLARGRQGRAQVDGTLRHSGVLWGTDQYVDWETDCHKPPSIIVTPVCPC